jgi:hypothetical protein
MTYEATGCQTYRLIRREPPTLDKAAIRITPYEIDAARAPPLPRMQRIVRTHNDWPLWRTGDWT